MHESYKLLVVDDEEDFLSTITKRLQRRGHKAQSAQNCKDALEMLKAYMPDAIILDVKLPDMDGIECLRAIKADFPRLPVILLTGHASMRAGVEGIASGASDYCLKPVDFDQLMDRIVIAISEANI